MAPAANSVQTLLVWNMEKLIAIGPTDLPGAPQPGQKTCLEQKVSHLH